MKKKAKHLALQMLARRRRSRYELEQYLERKGFNSEVYDSILDDFEKYGYIDDAEFARCWLRSRLNKRGFRAIRHELRAKGICGPVVEQVLNESGFAEEYHCAMKLVEKEFLRNGDNFDFQKILRSLNRRGYTCDVINKIRCVENFSVLNRASR